MTINERNEKLQDLRKKLAWLRTEEMAIEQTILDINREFRNDQLMKLSTNTY